MSLISCRNITKSFGDLTVLNGIDLDIARCEHIGLVGINGAGKTTLSNIISGKIQADIGKVIHHVRSLKIGYLLQSTAYTLNTFNSIFEENSSVLNENNFLEISSHLGLEKVQDWGEERISGLSGGEKTKLAIAHIWASKPDILILDEPTNHLDFQGVEWLINEIKNFETTTIIISHDRYFLDKTVNRIVEIEDGILTNFPGNYTFYREEKQRRYESQKRQYEERKKYEKKIELEIERLNNWSSKAHNEAGKVGKMADMRCGVKEFYRSKAKKMDTQVKSRIKRLQKIEIEGVQKPKEEAKLHFEWGAQEKKGKRLVVAKQIRKEFGNKLLFHDSSFSIQRGDKIGLVGPNGCGKTTLIRTICEEETIDSGEMWISPTLKISQLTQDVTDLNVEKTSNELIKETQFVRSEAQRLMNLLVSMGLGESMLKKPIDQLSLGERTRLKLAQLIIQDQDLLILDEPTNHLDLASRERLEDTLISYNGTLLVVSHDRYFLEKICDKLLVFKDGKIQKIESGYKGYLERIETKKKPIIKNKEQLEEEKMVIENHLIRIIGELGKYKPEDSKYQALDAEFNELMKRKKKLSE